MGLRRNGLLANLQTFLKDFLYLEGARDELNALDHLTPGFVLPNGGQDPLLKVANAAGVDNHPPGPDRILVDIQVDLHPQYVYNLLGAEYLEPFDDE